LSQTIIQATEDLIVDPASAKQITRAGSVEKSLHMIPAKRHGILNEDVGGAQIWLFRSSPRWLAAGPGNSSSHRPSAMDQGNNDICLRTAAPPLR
jgi:hypothetical protein